MHEGNFVSFVQNKGNLLETLAEQACQKQSEHLSTGLFTAFVDNLPHGLLSGEQQWTWRGTDFAYNAGPTLLTKC